MKANKTFEAENAILRNVVEQLCDPGNLTKILGPVKYHFDSREDYDEYKQNLYMQILDAKGASRKRIVEVMRTEPKGIYHNYIFSIVRFRAMEYLGKKKEREKKLLPITKDTEGARLKYGQYPIRTSRYAYNGENIMFADTTITSFNERKSRTEK